MYPLALTAAAFYGFPSRELAMTGITGTNGKTTIGFLVHHLLNAARQEWAAANRAVTDWERSRYFAQF